jgi:hypothetical protein
MGNIFKEPDLDKLIKEKTAMYSDALKNQPLMCQSCDSQYCMKCNAATYEKSDGENYLDKWSDHTSNWQVCKVFKTNEIVHHALRTALKSYKKPVFAIKAEQCSV